jgi:creatinine amidohydrolase
VGLLTWPEVERHIAGGAVGILPIGAGAKQHGRHLPMDTDRRQAEWLAARLIRRFNVLVWPSLSYGFYPAFVEYAGSCCVSEATFEALVEDVLGVARRQGVAQMAVVNTGVSTKPALERLSMRLSGVHLINVYDGPRMTALSSQVLEQSVGGHADERETSIMLAIDADAVNMAKAATWDRSLQPGRLRRSDSAHPNYSPDGVVGNPTLASLEKGRMLLSAMLEDVSQSLRPLFADQ